MNDLKNLFVKYGYKIKSSDIEKIYIFNGKINGTDGFNFFQFQEAIQNEEINKYFAEVIQKLKKK